MIKVGGRIRSLDFLTLFRWFIIYSAMGWIYESVFVYLVTGNMENRGFCLALYVQYMESAF